MVQQAERLRQIGQRLLRLERLLGQLPQAANLLLIYQSLTQDPMANVAKKLDALARPPAPNQPAGWRPERKQELPAMEAVSPLGWVGSSLSAEATRQPGLPAEASTPAPVKLSTQPGDQPWLFNPLPSPAGAERSEPIFPGQPAAAGEALHKPAHRPVSITGMPASPWQRSISPAEPESYLSLKPDTPAPEATFQGLRLTRDRTTLAKILRVNLEQSPREVLESSPAGGAVERTANRYGELDNTSTTAPAGLDLAARLPLPFLSPGPGGPEQSDSLSPGLDLAVAGPGYAGPPPLAVGSWVNPSPDFNGLNGAAQLPPLFPEDRYRSAPDLALLNRPDLEQLIEALVEQLELAYLRAYGTSGR